MLAPMCIRELTMSYTRVTLIYSNQSVAAPLLERLVVTADELPDTCHEGCYLLTQVSNGMVGSRGGVACNAPFEVVIHDDRFWTRANR